MKKVCFLLLTFLSLSIMSQKTIEKEFTLSTGTKKNVKIFVPKYYDTDTIHKYPVTIVLNDEYLFDLAKGNTRLYANADLAPRQIVVGIPTDTRVNQDVSIIRKNSGFTKNSKAFYNFVSKDLIPYLNINYNTSPFRIIVGEGYAANFATYFLKENKPLFNAYVCVTPKFTQQSNTLLSSYNLQRLDDVDNTYYLYVSNTPAYQKEEHTKAFNNLQEGLKSIEHEHLKLQFDKFKESPNSLSVISESVPRAFTHIFKLYRNISKKEFEENVKDLDPLDAIKYLEKKYIDINYLYGTNTNVRLEDFYAIEDIVMDKQDGDYLRVLGDFALIKHPNLPLGDYYMGMFYELGKDYERADEYYRFGYGKMDPSDPNTDAFYQNIERVSKLLESQPKKEESLPLEEENPIEEEDSQK